MPYIPQVAPPMQNYPSNSNTAKKTLQGANFTPPARNIQSQLGRPPSTHVDEFEKSKISIKAQLPTLDSQSEITENLNSNEVIVRTPSPTKLKDHQMVPKLSHFSSEYNHYKTKIYLSYFLFYKN